METFAEIIFRPHPCKKHFLLIIFLHLVNNFLNFLLGKV